MKQEMTTLTGERGYISRHAGTIGTQGGKKNAKATPLSPLHPAHRKHVLKNIDSHISV